LGISSFIPLEIEISQEEVITITAIIFYVLSTS